MQFSINQNFDHALAYGKGQRAVLFFYKGYSVQQRKRAVPINTHFQFSYLKNLKLTQRLLFYTDIKKPTSIDFRAIKLQETLISLRPQAQNNIPCSGCLNNVFTELINLMKCLTYPEEKWRISNIHGSNQLVWSRSTESASQYRKLFSSRLRKSMIQLNNLLTRKFSTIKPKIV